MLQKALHKEVALRSEPLACWRVHPIFEEEQLFVEVINRGAGILLIGFERVVRLRRDRGVIEGAAFVTAVGEGAGDANGAEGIQAISVLDSMAFQCSHGGRDAGALEREARDDLANVVGDRWRDLQQFKPQPRGPWTGFMIAARKFPISNVVKQRGQLYHKEIGVFFARDRKSRVPDALDVKPVVAGAFARKKLPHVVGCLLYDVPLA